MNQFECWDLSIDTDKLSCQQICLFSQKLSFLEFPVLPEEFHQ